MEWERIAFYEGAIIWVQDEDVSLKPKSLMICPGPTHGINRSITLTEGQTLTAFQLYELHSIFKQLAVKG